MDDRMDLTICTVSYKSASLLDLNMTLTRELNPASRLRWLVVDNNNDFSKNGIYDFELIQGDACLNQGKLRGSYHHAQALNKALKQVTSRYVLVLDPDFFILRKNWVRELIAHVSFNNISLLGAPYYPNLTWKRRYVPAAYCMFIDLEKISKDKLDFTPELDEYHNLYTCSTKTLLQILMGSIPQEFSNIDSSVLSDIAGVILRNRLVATPLARLFPKRFYVNTNISRDTGFKIQKEFGNNPHHHIETLIPSYTNDLFTKKEAVYMNLFSKMYYLLVPESLSIYPKRSDYSTPVQFKDFGFFDIRGKFGWEEYFWKEKPFAMHIKSGTKKFEDVGYDTLKGILFELTGEQAPLKVPAQITL